MTSSSGGSLWGMGEYGGQREWTRTGTNPSGIRSSPGPAQTNHLTCSSVPATGHKRPQSPLSCSGTGCSNHFLNRASFIYNNGIAQQNSVVEPRLWAELVGRRWQWQEKRGKEIVVALTWQSRWWGWNSSENESGRGSRACKHWHRATRQDFDTVDTVVRGSEEIAGGRDCGYCFCLISSL